MLSREINKVYAERMRRVCDFISEHIDEDLSVNKLSQVANFSKFHFHRQFSVYTGCSVAKYILKLRLKRASYQLVFNKNSLIIDIALDAGFENPESFSRAFKKYFIQTPSQFRTKPDWVLWHKNYEFPSCEIHNRTKRDNDMKTEIVDFKETKVAVLEHRGSHELLNDSVSVFMDWRKQSKLSPVPTNQSYGLVYDDPKAVKPENFRFDICGEVKAEVPENPQGIINKTIPGGRCVRLRHVGPHEAMDDKVHYLYGEWLPNSGEELRDFPCYFHYVNLYPDVSEHQLITDIYLPLK